MKMYSYEDVSFVEQNAISERRSSMKKVPETKKGELEKVQEELQKELEVWNNLGMSLDQTGHPPGSIYAMKMQIQTIINLLLAKNLVTNEEFNIEFKKLLLADMQKMRAENEPAIREARRQHILAGGKPDIAIPHLRLLGPDGRDLKI